MQKLILIGNHIGNFRDVSGRAIHMLKTADKIIYEDRGDFSRLIDDLQISITSDIVCQTDVYTPQERNAIAEELRNNKKIVFISDAGYPLIADPGHSLISFLIENDLDIEVIAGPSISSTALVAAALKESFGDFVFQEFFRFDLETIKSMAVILEPLPQALVLLDFPKRFPESINILIDTLGNRDAAFCIELTMPHSEIIRGTLKEIREYMEKDSYDSNKMSTLVITGKNPTLYA
jgi:16S rRNA (cytidine1402-2'-O)-methyltransferase